MSKLLVTLCLLPFLVGVTLSDNESFVVQGRVYCDTCRAGFETSVTEYIEGAKVRLECKNYSTGEVIQNADGVTDHTGTYELHVDDTHDDEICEVVLVESTHKDCSEIKVGRDRARVVLTHDNGISSHIRYPNSLGFLKGTPLPACGKILQMYALSDELSY